MSTAAITKQKTKYTCPKCGKTDYNARKYRFFIEVSGDIWNGYIKDDDKYVTINRYSYAYYGPSRDNILLICNRCYRSTTLHELESQKWKRIVKK